MRAKMGLALVQAAIDEISFVHAVIPTRLSMAGRYARVIISTRDRETDAPTNLQSQWRIPWREIFTPEHAISWLVAITREAWVHELHEAVFVDGTRRLDLHSGSSNAEPPPRDLINPYYPGTLKPHTSAARRSRSRYRVRTKRRSARSKLRR